MKPDRLDAAFAALADPTRRAILARLADGEASVNELAKPFSLTLPTVSRNLKVLEEAQLIARRKEAQFRLCRLEPETLREAVNWLSFYRRFWEESFAALNEHLQTQNQAKEKSHGKGRAAGKK
jgi:DNA-binding transcriptional ArsR family regulator